MKSPRPPVLKTMAMDGWVMLEPGEALCLVDDTPTRPSVEELRSKMQSVRGMVLAAGFTIENNMVLVQLADSFGTTDREKGVYWNLNGTGTQFEPADDFGRAVVSFGHIDSGIFSLSYGAAPDKLDQRVCFHPFLNGTVDTK